MELSNFLAEIWGFSLAVIGLSMLVNPHNFRKLLRFAEDEAMMYLSGVCSFVIGIASVLGHNIWVYDWRVVVTIFGWIALAKGVVRIFKPDFAKMWVNKVKDKEWLQYAMVVVVLVGCVMVYLGFAG